jgi:hypothetical protein
MLLFYLKNTETELKRQEKVWCMSKKLYGLNVATRRGASSLRGFR